MDTIFWCRSLTLASNRFISRTTRKVAVSILSPVSPSNVGSRPHLWHNHNHHHHHNYQHNHYPLYTRSCNRQSLHHHGQQRQHHGWREMVPLSPQPPPLARLEPVPLSLAVHALPKQAGFAATRWGRLGFGISDQFRQCAVTFTFPSPMTKLIAARFHTTGPLYVPPAFWMLFKPVAKVVALLGGRRLRLWWRSLPHQHRKKYKKEIYSSWQKYLVYAGTGALALVAYYCYHLQETPITKRIRFIAFTEDQFMKIANFEAKLQQSTFKNAILPASHPSYRRIIRILDRLVRTNHKIFKMKGQKWKVAIIRSTDSNAFVLPTGHVYVNEGLLKMVSNDDQLAVILAHELAHVVLGHAAEKVSYAQMIDVLLIISMAAIWMFLPFDGIALVTQAFYEKVVQILLDLPYSRKLEREADVVGLDLAARACYDIREGSNFWKQMEINDKLNQVSIPQWLSTHPVHSKRSELIDHLVPKATVLREQCGCPPLPLVDPRVRFKNFQDSIDDIIRSQKAGQNLMQVKFKD
ncbi:metalloendopeptidase OMA1, mitochondrial-like isoform X1 [Argonauta hians]